MDVEEFHFALRVRYALLQAESMSVSLFMPDTELTLRKSASVVFDIRVSTVLRFSFMV
jgi:hypothetical protein